MIRLFKEAEPTILAANRDAWTTEFTLGLDNRRYAIEDIRNALRDETHRKCAYCESHIDHVAYENVEHILPKSERPDLVCDWPNLTLACPKCNTNKGTYYNLDCLLVNPYSDSPSVHLRWLGPMVIAITQDRGSMTISRLDLNRSGLIYRRYEALAKAQKLMVQVTNNPGPIGAAIDEDLQRMQLDEAEYAAAVRALVATEATT
jgi:uncharacterized protein (TIGR02646 family)